MTRGIRNRNPFNIVRSANSWMGKVKHSEDDRFEQFISMEYGVRAGICNLLNGYIRKGINKVQDIIKRYAPANENNTFAYIDYICQTTPISLETEISIHSLSFYHLCAAICKYESDYILEYQFFVSIVRKYHLY